MCRNEVKLLKSIRYFKGGGGAKVTPTPLQPIKGEAASTITQTKERNPQRRFRGFGQSILSSGALGGGTGNSILGAP